MRWYQGSRSIFTGIGKDLQDAITSRDNQIATLEAERAAAAGRELEPEAENRVYLPLAREKFLEKKRLVDRDRETVTQYENLTAEFLAGVKKKFADELEEVDLLRFCDALRKRGCEERSVKNCGPTAVAPKLDKFFQTVLGWGLPTFTVVSEPDFCAPYAYLWLGRPWQTQEVVDRIRREAFTAKPGKLVNRVDGTLTRYLSPKPPPSADS